jgi:wyosine [tRNA(Phe)-imidazoG37] synthetase (radical SAM superfamily)
LIPGLNTTETELVPLRSAVYAIRPDRIQLNYLDRPGTQTWVSSPDAVLLRRIREFFAEGGIPVDITGFDEITPLLARDDSIALIDETLRRRPCTAEDLAQMTGLSAPEIRKKTGSDGSSGHYSGKKRGTWNFLLDLP